MIAFGSFMGINGSDVQGYAAVAGDVTISHYSISDQMPRPSGSELYLDASGHNRTIRNDLVVCGNLRFISGAVMGGGNLVYTDPLAVIEQPKASVYPPGQFVYQLSCPLDFADAQARLWTLSAGLAAYVRTGTSVFDYT